MALHSIKITIAATNTAQAVTDADLTTASIPLGKSKCANLVVINEAGNAAAGIRVGGSNAHLGNKIGIPIAAGANRDMPIANDRNAHDVKTTYISGTQNDVVGLVWMTE